MSLGTSFKNQKQHQSPELLPFCRPSPVCQRPPSTLSSITHSFLSLCLAPNSIRGTLLYQRSPELQGVSPPRDSSHILGSPPSNPQSPTPFHCCALTPNSDRETLLDHRPQQPGDQRGNRNKGTEEQNTHPTKSNSEIKTQTCNQSKPDA